MKIYELIEFLKAQDQDATVLCFMENHRDFASTEVIEIEDIKVESVAGKSCIIFGELNYIR